MAYEPYIRPTAIKSPLEILNGETQAKPLAPDLTGRGAGYANNLYDEPVTQVAVADTQASAAADEYKRLLRQMQAERKAAADAAFKQGKANLDTAKTAALRDGYVAYMQGLRNMPQLTAAVGNGGYAQSLAAKQQLGYENNRAAVEQGYLDNLRELQANRDAQIVSGNQDYLTELASLVKNTAEKAAANENGGYRYTLGGRTYDEQGLITYLKSLGMTQEAIARYLQAKGLTL